MTMELHALVCGVGCAMIMRLSNHLTHWDRPRTYLRGHASRHGRIEQVHRRVGLGVVVACAQPYLGHLALGTETGALRDGMGAWMGSRWGSR